LAGRKTGEGRREEGGERREERGERREERGEWRGTQMDGWQRRTLLTWTTWACTRSSAPAAALPACARNKSPVHAFMFFSLPAAITKRCSAEIWKQLGTLFTISMRVLLFTEILATDADALWSSN
jgi:hypothetical protein